MFEIEEWPVSHDRWSDLLHLAIELNQQRWLESTAKWHLSSHILVALKDQAVVGFLRYVVQAIGIDENLPPFTLEGQVLYEAKVLAFGVAPTERRQGIGRSLQERMIAACQAKGLYQIRSYSAPTHLENHMLKVAMGFGIHPLLAGSGKEGYYFVLPLNHRYKKPL